MSSESFYGIGRKPAPGLLKKPLRDELRGKPATGLITKLLVGQVHGFIRLNDNREVFFHRGDLREGTTFNELQIGDRVSFELLEDSVSGARALRVARRRDQ
jgi:cold shock CspA family protein